MSGSFGMSREGALPAVVATYGLWGGRALVLRFGRNYLDSSWGNLAIFGSGVALLALAGWMVTRLARRLDYPWLMAVAAAAVPLYDPQGKPDTLFWRMFSAAYGLVLVLVAVYAFWRMVSRTDELERRINQEALAFAFAASLVLAMSHSLFQELLPPLSGLWVAAAMIAAWLVGWNVAVRRYR